MRDRLFQIVLALMLLAATVGCAFLGVTALRPNAPIWFVVAGVAFILTLVVAFAPVQRLPIPRRRKWKPWVPTGDVAFAQSIQRGDPVPQVRFSLGSGRGHQYTVETGEVERISFITPFQRTVRKADIPLTVPFRWKRFHPKPEVRVLDFTNRGVVLDDQVPEPITATFLFYRVPADPPG